MNGHVAMLLPELRAGGAQKVFLALAKEFVVRGVRVDLVLAQQEGDLLAEVPPGVRLVPLRDHKKGWKTYGAKTLAFSTLPLLIRYLRAKRPDAILSTLTGTNLIAVVAHRLARVPTRLVLREAATLENLRHPFFYLPLMRGLYRRADKVVVLSSYMKNQLERKLQLLPDKVIHIPNPVDLSKIQQDAAEPLPNDYDASRPYALTVGRLTPQKDYMTLLEAFRVVAQSSPLRLVILGEGPDRSMIEKRIRKFELGDRIELRGFDSNPYRWMARAHIFVLSSRWEGMPNTILEARALGIPIVMTEYDPSAREVGGQSAILVPVGNVTALVEAISRSSFERPAEEPCLPQELMEAHSAYLRVMDLKRGRTDDDPSNQ
jgi:glycosyltransferase involved in cell wall biosynthesis